MVRFAPPDDHELAIRPPSEIVIATGQSLQTYVPANSLELGAASAVASPASSTGTAPIAASAMHPTSVHRLIDRVIVHLVFVRSRPRHRRRTSRRRRGEGHGVPLAADTALGA